MKSSCQKKFQLAALGILMLLFANCATTISREQMMVETKDYTLPATLNDSPGKSLVYVVRPSGVGALVRFNVFVDDHKNPSLEAGYNRGSQYFYFLLKPGPHTLYSIAENIAELEINTEPGQTYFVKQTPSMGLIMARNNLEKIDEVEGRYHVKKLALGTIKKSELP